MEFIIRYRKAEKGVISKRMIRNFFPDVKSVLNSIDNLVADVCGIVSFRVESISELPEHSLCYFRIYENSELIFCLEGSLYRGTLMNCSIEPHLKANPDLLNQTEAISHSVRSYHIDNTFLLFGDNWFFSGQVAVYTEGWEKQIFLD